MTYDDACVTQGVQTQLAAKSKGAQKAAGLLTNVSKLRMKAARRFSRGVIRDTTPKAPERVRFNACLSRFCVGIFLRYNRVGTAVVQRTIFVMHFRLSVRA